MSFKSYKNFSPTQARGCGEPQGPQRQLACESKRPTESPASSEGIGQGTTAVLEAESLPQVSQLEQKYDTCLRRFPETASPLWRALVAFTLSGKGVAEVSEPDWPPVTLHHHFIWLTPSPAGDLWWSPHLSHPLSSSAWLSITSFCHGF